MTEQLPKTYEFDNIQHHVADKWRKEGIFRAIPDERENRYVIMMPLPNVTGALHMGHAMDNVMQDLLIRWHRMLGDNTLWMPGTDHAGIATQAVVEKRLFELEGKTRHDIGREALVTRIWEWKDQYQQRIIKQLKRMGCSCDWDRIRFTMDAVCSRAVRETFFRMFRDELIYRGNRLVNWDCQLQTAVSDDEIIYEAVPGHFWHIRYPIIDAADDEPQFITVATTRPETMLGDTAVACHPDPKEALQQRLNKLAQRLKTVKGRDRGELEKEYEETKVLMKERLPQLEQLVEMAKEGRMISLPLLNRPIPLITDQWAKPELGSGCVKITPAHDPNDYEVWQRNKHVIDAINILNPDGTLNENAGPYAGLDRFEARDRVVQDLQNGGFLVNIEDREIEIGHSDRSKTAIEPYLSKQWFVRMGDIPGGITLGKGTDKEFQSPGLAQAAINAVQGEWRSSSGRKLEFHPDPKRYATTYINWLSEKRDWCISRQLWWGHRIPIWHTSAPPDEIVNILENIKPAVEDKESAWTLIMDSEGVSFTPEQFMSNKQSADGDNDLLLCLRNEQADKKYAALLEKFGLQHDEDVLDTWFSSALWPHSTLGWPDAKTAPVEEGQLSLGATHKGGPDCLSYYYPGSCLVTGRDIITLWIARMVITGLYNLGDVPFTDAFIHANILDGKGERMSKSKGNGIDPVDIIDRYGADAMRYVLCDMQTGTQDIRLPVQAVSPYTGEIVDLAKAKHGRSIFTYICPRSGKEFDVLGTMSDLPSATIISDRFDVGKHFCNKLWNAARFTLMNLQPINSDSVALRPCELQFEDRWILSRLTRTIALVTEHLEQYNPSAAIGRVRAFFWSEFCDWYLELIKPRFKENRPQRTIDQMLAFVIDQVLRLLHPFIPYITEAIWEKLTEIVTTRGITEQLDSPNCIASAKWPEPHTDWLDQSAEEDMALMQLVVREIRNVRSLHNVPPGKRVTALVKTSEEDSQTLQRLASLIENSAHLERFSAGTDVSRPANATIAVAGEHEVYVLGVIDPEKERVRLEQKKSKLEKQLASVEKKLANRNFLEKAPRKVVEETRQKRDDLSNELHLIHENLANLN